MLSFFISILFRQGMFTFWKYNKPHNSFHCLEQNVKLGSAIWYKETKARRRLVVGSTLVTLPARVSYRSNLDVESDSDELGYSWVELTQSDALLHEYRHAKRIEFPPFPCQGEKLFKWPLSSSNQSFAAAESSITSPQRTCPTPRS